MAALKASELKYSTVLKTSVGGLWLTATRVEIPSGKEYEVGTLELNLEKLRTGGQGLTDESVAGLGKVLPDGLAPVAGEIATTTALPALVWCDPFTVAVTTDTESAKEVTEGYLAKVSVVGTPPGTKAYLRFYGLTTAGDGKPLNEIKTATKITFTAAQAITVYAVGR
jgi:hypothetical protein